MVPVQAAARGSFQIFIGTSIPSAARGQSRVPSYNIYSLRCSCHVNNRYILPAPDVITMWTKCSGRVQIFSINIPEHEFVRRQSRARKRSEGRKLQHEKARTRRSSCACRSTHQGRAPPRIEYPQPPAVVPQAYLRADRCRRGSWGRVLALLQLGPFRSQ